MKKIIILCTLTYICIQYSNISGMLSQKLRTTVNSIKNRKISDKTEILYDQVMFRTMSENNILKEENSSLKEQLKSQIKITLDMQNKGILLTDTQEIMNFRSEDKRSSSE